MATQNLGITELAQSQAQKVVTINEAFSALDAATQGVAEIEVTGNFTLDPETFISAFLFVFSGSLSSTTTITVPATARFFAVSNQTGAAITISNGTVHLSIPASRKRIIHISEIAVLTL